MRRRSFQRDASVGKINVTPMIDVVMCLIVFFLIVGKLAADKLENVDLPSATSGREGGGAPLIINAAVEEERLRVVIQGRSMDLDEVEAEVRDLVESGVSQSVQLRASRRLSYGAIRPVVDACRRAGVRTIALAAEVDR
ncbi:MAG: biopolymer transporter ExbD [Phycisphaeraceae bacterium]|nr:biopolymer transporter ExbD [Phycisphaeraceae bacterium]